MPIKLHCNQECVSRYMVLLIRLNSASLRTVAKMSLCDVIYVYDGLGAKPSCTEHSLKCLRSWASGTNYKITTITPSEILEGKEFWSNFKRVTYII